MIIQFKYVFGKNLNINYQEGKKKLVKLEENKKTDGNRWIANLFTAKIGRGLLINFM